MSVLDMVQLVDGLGMKILTVDLFKIYKAIFLNISKLRFKNMKE